MESCEVLIIGGGPAGSTCGAGLAAAGINVLLLDQAHFPRPKPCAGWITPAVLRELAITPAEYGRGRLLQEISGFRTGLIGGPTIVTRYPQVVSYGIRRDEFDHFLLQRSRVRCRFGAKATRIERIAGGWRVNGEIEAKLLVGAGGHFCPVARLLGARLGEEEVVLAQVAEVRLNPEEERECPVAGDTPALFFSADLQGYGWLFRKGNRLNVGLGRQDRSDFCAHTRNFCADLIARRELPRNFSAPWQGHAYRLYHPREGRCCCGEGVLLVGDAAGLAGVQSGEGILPAILSARFAALAIVAARGDYRRARLEPYAARLAGVLGRGRPLLPPLPAALQQRLGAALLANRWLTRHLLLNRCFLHLDQQGGLF